MDEKQRRRNWIKNALIVFLVVLLILTFCSDSIMNAYLPEVSTEAATSGRIQETIRGSGTAEVNQACLVKLAASRTIKTVNVSVGQEVKEGDILFTLESGDGTDVDAAKNTFIELQTEYQKKLLGTDFNYDKDTVAIENARKEYQKALEAYNDVDSNNKKLQNMQNKDARYTKKIADLEKKIAEQDVTITDLSAKIDTDAAQLELTTKQRTVVGLNNEKADLAADVNTLTAEINTLKTQIANTPQVTPDPEGEGTVPQDVSLQSQLEEKQKLLIEKQRALRDKEVEIANAEADVAVAAAALKTVKDNKAKLETEKKKKSDYEKTLAAKKEAQQKLQTEIETFKVTVKDKTEAKNIVDEKESAWTSLVAEYEAKKSEDNHTKENDKIDLNAAKQKLIAQKKIVEDLMETAGETEVKALIDGRVTAINCAAGDIIQPDSPIATISSADDGFVVKISVSREQASKVKVGMNGSVDNYWYGDITAVLASTENDTENPGNVLLNFAVKGDYINQGDSLTISIGGESKSYDVVVPKSSINSDNNGKFVLTLDSKSTPLGTRYIATRHDVTVLAEDDVRSAISSDLYGYEYVIMTASEALTPGDQVKLKE